MPFTLFRCQPPERKITPPPCSPEERPASPSAVRAARSSRGQPLPSRCKQHTATINHREEGLPSKGRHATPASPNARPTSPHPHGGRHCNRISLSPAERMEAGGSEWLACPDISARPTDNLPSALRHREAHRPDEA